MHEMSITQGIIEICERNAGDKRIISLDVEIGALSGIVPEAVEFCFEACCAGTPLEGAKLNIIRIPGKGTCQECGADTLLQELYGSCQHCGGDHVVICAGEEMRVREIEVED